MEINFTEYIYIYIYLQTQTHIYICDDRQIGKK